MEPQWAHLPLLLLLLPLSLHHCAHAQSGTSSTPPFGLSLRDNLKASFSVMVVAFLSAFVFVGFCSLYLRHCANTYISTRNPIAAAADLFRGRLHREVINNCPILIYSTVKDLKIGKSALECAVCLGEYQDKDKIRLLPKCHHVFHPDCIDAWFISHLTCPVCRATLTSSDCADNAVVVPMEPNPSESYPQTAEMEQQSSAESQVPEQTVNADQSETAPPTQTPPTQPRILIKFPRSHSTGHSLFMTEPEEMLDRHTLRLPEHVRKQILVNHSRIRRSASSDIVLPGVWSSKIGRYRREEEGSDNMKRWVFSMTPPFVSRDWSSVKSLKQDTETLSHRAPV